MVQAAGIVVAGSRPFVRAVASSLRRRRRVVVGIAGRTERDFILANASGGLFVFEHGGEQWRTLLDELKDARQAGLRIVAVVPAELADEADALEQAGAHAVFQWDGVTPDAVVAGAEALLADRHVTPEPPARPPTRLPFRLTEGSAAEPGSRWDPRTCMAPCARIVSRKPVGRWRRVASVFGAFFALTVLIG